MAKNPRGIEIICWGRKICKTFLAFHRKMLMLCKIKADIRDSFVKISSWFYFWQLILLIWTVYFIRDDLDIKFLSLMTAAWWRSCGCWYQKRIIDVDIFKILFCCNRHPHGYHHVASIQKKSWIIQVAFWWSTQ